MQDTKIYLKLDKRPKNVADVLQLLFVRNDSIMGISDSKKTYKDKDCKIEQCRERKYRSMDDIYYLCKTYFPNVTVKKVMHELLMFKSGDRYKAIQFYNCNTMKKLRVIPMSYATYAESIGCSKYDSQWSWKELFSLVGINSQNDLINYTNKHKK